MGKAVFFSAHFLEAQKAEFGERVTSEHPRQAGSTLRSRHRSKSDLSTTKCVVVVLEHCCSLYVTNTGM